MSTSKRMIGPNGKFMKFDDSKVDVDGYKVIEGGKPISEIGKIKCALGSRKVVSKAAFQDRPSKVRNMMEKAGVNFNIPGKAYKTRNLFEIWLRGRSTKELTEIQQLDSLIILLDADITQRVMEKLTMGVAIDDSDVKTIKLLKDSLVDLHKMKYGEKKLNINAEYKDIREMMFGVDSRDK